MHFEGIKCNEFMNEEILSDYFSILAKHVSKNILQLI